jgi:long-chain acyl-CoA synthetase
LLERIVVADKRAMFNYDDPRIISFAEVEELGRQLGSERKSLFLDRVNDIRADELAIFVFTSGTTGAPKAAMHSHRDVIVGQSHAYLEGYPELERRQHRLVTHLPLAHLVERSIPLYLPLISDIVVYFGEDVETLPITLFEVMPTFFHGVPRIWEKLASQFLVGIERSSRFKRLMFNAATRMGESYISHVWKGKPVPLHIRVGYSLSKNLVFRPMLMKAGLSRLEAGLTAGGPISDRVQRLWQMWGVNLRNIYGITEGTVISCQSGDFPPPGDAGPVVYPKEVRLGADGEVLVRGRGLFLGYYRDEAATQAALEDGWLKTGDIAQWVVQGDKTVLKLVDRKKDLMITKGGKNISPSEVETCLKSSPYISEAILFADNRKYPAALIEIDFDTVAEWARQRGISYNGFASLATSAPVDKLITEEIEKANRNLARVEQVKKFRIIPKELDPEEGGTTPTRKVKRKYIYEMFRDTVEGMFDKDQELDKAS